ncbi:MAG: hypothetical protein D6752_01300, partial [Candidatus Nitrosothermus koennekii]
MPPEDTTVVEEDQQQQQEQVPQQPAYYPGMTPEEIQDFRKYTGQPVEDISITPEEIEEESTTPQVEKDQGPQVATSTPPAEEGPGIGEILQDAMQNFASSFGEDQQQPQQQKSAVEVQPPSKEVLVRTQTPTTVN